MSEKRARRKKMVKGPRPAKHVKLPDERKGFIHKFTVEGTKGYLRTSFYDDGKLGEIFIKIAKEGSTLSGLIDAFATSISMGLQRGVELKEFCVKFIGKRFEPSGSSKNPDLPVVKSILDYIFRYLKIKCLSPEDQTWVDEKLDKEKIGLDK